ncbi:MAG TPA: hypothetical protein VF795_00845 [Desulfuromonadaceae bacterium]
MSERPLNIGLSAWSDAGYLETIQCTTNGAPTDFSAWTGLELVAAESVYAAAPAFTGVVTAPAPGTLQVEIPEATLKALFPEGSQPSYRQYVYALRAKPTGAYRVRLMYGTISVNRGLP